MPLASMWIIETIGLWIIETAVLIFVAFDGLISANAFGTIGAICLFGTPIFVIWARWSGRRAAARAQHAFFASAVTQGIEDADKRMQSRRSPTGENSAR